MEINNHQQTVRAIEEWRKEPVPAQRRFINKAIDSLELGQLHYENRGNDAAVVRLEECIALLRARLEELRC